MRRSDVVLHRVSWLCLFVVGFVLMPRCEAGPYSGFDAQAKAIVAKMTLDEKIGQMTQAEFVEPNKLADIETYFLGSLLNGATLNPLEGNSVEAWTNLYDNAQKHALKTRLAIPLLYGVDAVHGHNNVQNAVIFPHPIGLGCTRNAALVEKIGRVTAEEMRATGFHWTFAPCVTVPQDIRWGRTYEGFAENPELVNQLGAAMTRGLQNGDISGPLSVLACAKHFAGDGGTVWGWYKSDSPDFDGPPSFLDQGDVKSDEATFRKIHLYPYPASIGWDVGTIMPSFSSWNGVKCSANRYLLTNILKEEMGFEGFLISDYNAVSQVDKDYKTAIKETVNAGMDMMMVPKRYAEYIGCLKELVEEGKVPMSRIDDAVTRILRVKIAMGLMDKNHSVLADRSLHKTFGSAEHRAVARQAVRESLVLLKNENKILPLSRQAVRIHVGGKSADDIGNQCGGWTIHWQGESGNVITGGTTILSAIKNTVSKNTQVTFSKDGLGAAGANVGVVVIGETPYAEGGGDRKDLSLDKEDVVAVQNMKKAGIPVVVILISGRPMIVNTVLEQADAFVAAWLPGTEGQGVADVLFGDNKPTGKLSFTWPRSMGQIPLSVAIQSRPLFDYGYGLSY